ncbi:MAG: NAD(P)/FAD-dependent oxidoreductase [Herpetosiphonaceae bacterium]|nr:NAD(P)/FAD-dependent oxidoreductase [Herpetosiphonaceae bacterium]
MDSHVAQTDVVVVGGGMAGLTAACYLARAGVAVTLFEKAAELGGRAATQVYNDYSFNRGAHALYPGGAAWCVLRELGIRYSSQSPKGTFMLRQGKLQAFPADPLTLLRTDLLQAVDKLEFTRMLAALALCKAHDLQHVSVQAWLESSTQRPRLRQVLAALARTLTYSAALDQISAEVFVTQLQLSLKHNVLYIDGGWQMLVDGLRKVAQQAGVQIVRGARVEAIEEQGGRARGVRLQDGSTVAAADVIIATNPQAAAKLVDAGCYPTLRRVVDAIVPIEAACLDVALRRLPSARHPVVFDEEHPRFLTVQSLFAKIAPQGGALIHTIKYLDPAKPSDPRADERDLEDFLDILQPGWRDELVKRSYLPRIEAVSLWPTASSGGFGGRPGPQVAGIVGVYLAGDWIGNEGYLADASMASAREVAQLILRGKRITSQPLEQSHALLQEA